MRETSRRNLLRYSIALSLKLNTATLKYMNVMHKHCVKIELVEIYSVTVQYMNIIYMNII